MTIEEQLERDEGYRQFAYKDSVGVLTVGIGRNLEHVGISKEEAIALLRNDVARAIVSLRRAFPWFDSLSQPHQGALVNMTFNMGIDGLSAFRLMLQAIERGDYDSAAKEMLDSKWAKQVGLRAERLAQQMRLNQWV